jgi:transposase-like protein
MEGTRRDEAEVGDLAETEGARRASGVSATGGAALDPEVPAKAKRRQFSAEYRLRVLREADGCRAPGDVGALLRREGLYSSHLVLWRRQREAGALSGLRSQKRGPKPKAQDPRVKPADKKLYPNWVPALGLVFCLMLAGSQQPITIVSGLALLAVGFGLRLAVHATGAEAPAR